MTNNLLSISKLTRDLNCKAIFSQNDCLIKELALERMIGTAQHSERLYLLKNPWYYPTNGIKKSHPLGDGVPHYAGLYQSSYLTPIPETDSRFVRK